MITQFVTRPFPVLLVFPDVDPPVLLRDEGTVLDARSMLEGAWTNYLRRILPPVAEQGRSRVPSVPYAVG